MSVSCLLVKYSQYLVRCCLKGIIGVHIKHNTIVLTIFREYILFFCAFLKKHTNTQFQTLLDIVVIDYPLKKERFEVVYVFLSINRNTRLLIKCQLTTLAALSSITRYYSAACWFEREAWDLFGVFFINNFDLRRILTDYGFEGHPFRKDFPLSGYVELRYDENQKRIISDFVEVSQEYRHFDFL